MPVLGQGPRIGAEIGCGIKRFVCYSETIQKRAIGFRRSPSTLSAFGSAMRGAAPCFRPATRGAGCSVVPLRDFLFQALPRWRFGLVCRNRHDSFQFTAGGTLSDRNCCDFAVGLVPDFGIYTVGVKRKHRAATVRERTEREHLPANRSLTVAARLKSLICKSREQ